MNKTLAQSPQYLTSSSNDDSDICFDYAPDLSRITEESDMSKEEEQCSKHTKKKHISNRNFKRYKVNGKITRTTPERIMVKEVFKNYLTEKNDIIPDLETCQEFIYQNDALKNRTPSQIRAWIINYMKRNQFY